MKKTKKRRPRLARALLIFGWAALLAMQVMNCGAEVKSAGAVRTRAEEVQKLSYEDKKDSLDRARTYNRELSTLCLQHPFLFQGTNALDVRAHAMPKAELIIPSIDVDLPVCPGTQEEVLSECIGHMDGTSLPVGGMSTHAALAGHTGLAGRELFTKLSQVKTGELFCVCVLGEDHWYRVDGIRVVEPERASLYLQILPGRDLITLYTCTPIGVNNKRLLVRGSRIPNESVRESTGAILCSTETRVRCSFLRVLLVLMSGLIGKFYWRRK